MNIEAAIIAHLKSKGFNAVANVPEKRPDEFVTVERTGGGKDALDRPTVAVQAWSTTKYKASELMLAVDAAMLDLTSVDEVTKITRNTLYNFPDVSGQPRYQAVYNIVTY